MSRNPGRHRMWRATRGAIPFVAMLALMSLPIQGFSQASFAGQTDDAEITFTADVAPILQENCEQCHKPGSIAPMSLITYEEVRPWAPLIKERVQDRIMPPWHIDPAVGIQDFKNDISLTEDEINTIVRWVDAGTPQGDPADMPPPVEWGDERAWSFAEEFGEPDLIVKSAPFTVPAQGQDLWWRPSVETGLTEDRWIRAISVRPSEQGASFTHHVLVSVRQEQSVGGLLTEWAIGKTGEIYPEGTGKLLQAGSELSFEAHYWPSGTEGPDDQVEVGFWFYPEGYEPEMPTSLMPFFVAGGSNLEIQPNELAIHQSTQRLRNPVRLQSYQPHMHMRGKGMMMEAIYPNGRSEVLNLVSDFQWRWHNNYIYSDDAAPLLPEGTILKFTSWHDNRESNPANPDHEQYVTWGDRTVDEMAHAWIGVTNLSQEQYERLVAEREAQEDVAQDD